MNSTNAAVDQMAKYYWGMLGAARTTTTGAGAATSSLIRSSWPPPAAHGRSGGEPSWEELAFARDAAGQLGGCVWPPRSYTCTFCRREFRSAQALGGHMNVHRRDRARLRQCASPSSPPDHDQEPIAAPLPAPELADHHQLLQLQGSPLFRTTKAAVLISGRPASDHHHHQNYYNNNREEEAVITTTTTTTTSPRYTSTTIIKESKSKVVISIPASTAGSKEAAIAIMGEEEEEEEEEEEIMVAGRRKRRRVVPQPPEPAFTSPFYDLRLPASSPKGGVEHDAKVPKVTSSSPSSLSPLHHLAGRQEEVDLELRLGTS
ncbi:unnamed protein product [Miscanthus lutarioriparius]|uniref:C2H2-type domain-containing protein n=1 Tax=Miscanthus lutarioriparius TaxID=422564 RepID=A0A811NCJ1_9POAL|nr:unnamed protein product [Miscanthus lutarioriparius]